MILRTITSLTQPLQFPDGTLLTARMLWSLVDADGQPVAGTDADTNQRVVYRRFPVSCVNGIFSVELWPTTSDKAGRSLFYLCEIPDYDFATMHPFSDIGGPYSITFAEWSGLEFFPTSYIVTEDGDLITTEDSFAVNTEVANG